MSVISQLLVELGLDARKFHEGMGEAEGKAHGFGGVLTSALGTAAGFLGGELITEGIGKIGEFLKKSTEAAKEDQLAMAQTNAVLLSTKGVSGQTAESVDALATSMAGLTRFSKDTTVSAENMLLTFTNIKGDVFPAATKAVLDMSQALGQDTKSSAIQLGKALNDPIKGITALSRVGVTFTKDQKDMIKAMVEAGNTAGAQGIILKEIATEFGGSAEAAGKTAAGQADIMGHKFTEMQVKVGDVLLNLGNKLMLTFGPTLIALLTGFTDVISSPVIAQAIDAIGAVITQLGALVPGVITAITTQFGSLNTSISTSVGGVRETFSGMIAHVQPIMANLSSAWRTAQQVISSVTTAISSIVNTVFGNVATFIKNHSADIQNTFGTAWEKISAIIDLAAQLIQVTIVPIFNAIAQFINDNQAGIQTALQLVWDAIKLIVGTTLDLITGIIKVALDIIHGNWSQAWTDIKQTVTNVWDNIMTFLGGIPAQMLAAGEAMIQGIIDGINNKASSLVNSLTNTVSNAVDGVKNFLGWHSPSKLFMQAGDSIVDGLTNRLEAGRSQVSAAMRGLTGAATGQFGVSVNGAGTGGGGNTAYITINVNGGNANDVGDAVMHSLRTAGFQVAS